VEKVRMRGVAILDVEGAENFEPLRKKEIAARSAPPKEFDCGARLKKRSIQAVDFFVIARPKAVAISCAGAEPELPRQSLRSFLAMTHVKNYTKSMRYGGTVLL
jgi:hypothetical protein